MRQLWIKIQPEETELSNSLALDFLSDPPNIKTQHVLNRVQVKKDHRMLFQLAGGQKR